MKRFLKALLGLALVSPAIFCLGVDTYMNCKGSHAALKFLVLITTALVTTALVICFMFTKGAELLVDAWRKPRRSK